MKANLLLIPKSPNVTKYMELCLTPVCFTNNPIELRLAYIWCNDECQLLQAVDTYICKYAHDVLGTYMRVCTKTHSHNTQKRCIFLSIYTSYIQKFLGTFSKLGIKWIFQKLNFRWKVLNAPKRYTNSHSQLFLIIYTRTHTVR